MNIKICFELRILFIEYYELVMKIFEEQSKFSIKNNAINYFKRDEFAYLLDQIIKRCITNNKGLSNIEKLAIITKYNPYYREPKYFIKVNTDIFDSFNLDNIDDEFIKDFRRMNFEQIFKNNIDDYIKKIFSKIKNISNFTNVIKLIHIQKLENKNIILELLNKSYDNIIEKEIGSLKDKQLDEAVNVVANLALINFKYEKQEKQFDFINIRVKKLKKNIIPKIFIEIIKICIKKRKLLEEDIDSDKKEYKNEDKEDIDTENKKEEEDDINFKKMKYYIFDEFANKLDNNNDIDNIVNLIDCLEDENDKEMEGNVKKNEREKIKNEFLNILFKKNLFTQEEFFSDNQSLKISLLYKLYIKGKIKSNEEEYYGSIFKLLNDIKDDIGGKIKKKKLEEFLKNDESFIKERLELIKLVLQTFEPDEQYQNMKKINEEMNEDIKKLKFIKDNIIIYFKETYKDMIKTLIDTINNNQNKETQQYNKGKMKDVIKQSKELNALAEKIDKVKNFLLFNIIYEMNSGKDENTHFRKAYIELGKIGKLLNENKINDLYKSYKVIFDKIKEKLSYNEDRAQEFIKKLINYYGINKEDLKNELIILFKSKKYDLDINSMIFFFEYFQKDNEKWNEKLSEKYKDLSKKNFEEIKSKLKELKNNEIYDYENIKNYNKLFTCLYNKKEAIEYLFSKIDHNLEYLKDRIQPTDRRINIKDISDAEKCISHIKKMKNLNDNFSIFDYIKNIEKYDKNAILQFEKYSQIYPSIIELDRNDDNSENIFKQVNSIIQDKLVLNILQDSENFLYSYNNELKKITMEELIHLKNKIHIKNINDINDEKDILKSKCKILLFFKEIISNLEIIIGYMKVLRTKGSSLPIKIVLEMNTKDIKYQLGGEKQ